VGEWLLSFWGEHLKQREAAGALECVAEEGDCVFVPHGWWHMVINLDGLSVAVTQNYVSTSNLSDVLHFLREKPDQISGLGLARLGSPSVDSGTPVGRAQIYEPEELHGSFVARLREFYPDMTRQLDEATKEDGLSGGAIGSNCLTFGRKRKRSALNLMTAGDSGAGTAADDGGKGGSESSFQFSFF